RVALLTGSQPAAARREALLDAASGAAGIVIGTHALLAEQVQFADLGLVVVDEQHRFGVEQRDILREKAQDGRPHVLVMTATPIPRTVAMTVYGDLDVSTLSELPAGRSSIATHVVPAADKPRYLERAWERVREVGVDVPNATTMVVMDAERFGVSQLHQLRGRVGRGKVPGLCLLVTEAAEGGKSRERLEAVATTLDGFKLSRLDLEQRREGDV